MQQRLRAAALLALSLVAAAVFCVWVPPWQTGTVLYERSDFPYYRKAWCPRHDNHSRAMIATIHAVWSHPNLQQYDCDWDLNERLAAYVPWWRAHVNTSYWVRYNWGLGDGSVMHRTGYPLGSRTPDRLYDWYKDQGYNNEFQRVRQKALFRAAAERIARGSLAPSEVAGAERIPRTGEHHWRFDPVGQQADMGGASGATSKMEAYRRVVGKFLAAFRDVGSPDGGSVGRREGSWDGAAEPRGWMEREEEARSSGGGAEGVVDAERGSDALAEGDGYVGDPYDRIWDHPEPWASR